MILTSPPLKGQVVRLAVLSRIQSIVDFEAGDCVKAMKNLGCLKEGAEALKAVVW